MAAFFISDLWDK